jgi:hypothetical protein
MTVNLDPFVVPVILILIAASVSFLVALYWHHRGDAKALKEAESKQAEALKEQVALLKSELELVRQAIVPISTAFQSLLIKELTHFHTPVMDALLTKIGPPYMLTDVEEKELVAALHDRMSEDSGLMTESERNAATMLPMVIKRVKSEASLGINELQIQLVTIPNGDHKDAT